MEILETLARYRMLGKVQGRISQDVQVLWRWAYEQNSHLSFQCAHHNHSQLMAIVNTLVLDTDSQTLGNISINDKLILAGFGSDTDNG